jgi:hypothetical protein
MGRILVSRQSFWDVATSTLPMAGCSGILGQTRDEGGAVTKFKDWCVESEVSVASHKLNLLTAEVAKAPDAIKLMAKAILEYYASPVRVAALLRTLGRRAVAKYIEEKLPTKPKIQSGELAEILCTAYVYETTPYTQGIKRLRWKDHRDMSMRGEDLLAFNLNSKNGRLDVLKAEVKSREKLTSTVVGQAREALSSNSGLPSPHAMSMVADRLHETGETVLADALDKAQLIDGLDASRVLHMLFTFSGNDATSLLKKNLATYSGTVTQKYVGLQVEAHQDFIKAVFEAVGK